MTQQLEGTFQAPGFWGAIQTIISLLRLTANDPSQAERCVFTSAPTAVTATAIVTIAQAQDRSKTYSTLILWFTSGSGSGRRTIDGSQPTAAGTQGVQIPAGGGQYTIRGAENIRNFQLIAETGQSMSFTAELFQAATFPGDVR